MHQKSIVLVTSPESSFQKVKNADAILMLDGEFDIMSIFTLALEWQGFHVIGFTEPVLALDHFQKNYDRYWLIVSDIRMPLIDGYQFIKRVKVFFMSAFLSDDIQYRSGLTSVKVDEYIEKPISLDDFMRLVEKYFLTTETSKN